MADKILIVDDNEHILKLLKISLEKAGYDVAVAHDGDEGLELANKVTPALIISDVMMPSTDGIEFCWMVRENSNVPMVPIIFLTSVADKEMEIRGFRAGADEYLVKPVDRNTLLEKVNALLQRSRKVKEIDTGGAAAVKGFEGNLKDFSLAEIVQLLNLNQRSGVLHINAELNGDVVFDNGNMIFAKYGHLEGEDAIYKVVPEQNGQFHFEPGEKKVSPNIHGATMNILLEACRQADESKLADS